MRHQFLSQLALKNHKLFFQVVRLIYNYGRLNPPKDKSLQEILSLPYDKFESAVKAILKNKSYDSAIVYDGEKFVGLNLFKIDYKNKLLKGFFVFIQEEFRGKGVQAELIRVLLDKAKELDFKGIQIGRGTNPKIVSAIEKFKKTKVRTKYSKTAVRPKKGLILFHPRK